MPKYGMKQLTRYAHPAPVKPQHCPFSSNPITYIKDNQATTPADDSPLLDNAGKKWIEQVVGSFLYYAQAVAVTILIALSDIATQQAASTKNTKKWVTQFLDYMWTHPDAKICYCASNLILNVHSDASYLSAPRVCSHARGFFFLGSLPVDGDPIKLNGAIHITCSILNLVAALAAEAELGALFLNAQEAKILRLTLLELGHPQPLTPIHIDNTTTLGFVLPSRQTSKVGHGDGHHEDQAAAAACIGRTGTPVSNLSDSARKPMMPWTGGGASESWLATGWVQICLSCRNISGTMQRWGVMLGAIMVSPLEPIKASHRGGLSPASYSMFVSTVL
jgi:hypothetical protein